VIGDAVGAEQLLRAARDEALGRCLGKGAKGRARRPVRMVAGAVLAAVKSEGVVEALVLSGQSIGSLVAAADAHVAAALVVRWPASLCDAAACERLWATLTRTGNGWHAAVGEVKARQKRYGGPRVAAWARALRWAATVGFEGWRPAACSLLDEAAACASLAHLLDALSTRGAEVVPPALAELLTDRYGEWPCAPRAAPSLAAAAAPAIAPPPPLDIESLPAATLEQAGTLPRGEQLSMARLCDMVFWTSHASFPRRNLSLSTSRTAYGRCTGASRRWQGRSDAAARRRFALESTRSGQMRWRRTRRRRRRSRPPLLRGGGPLGGPRGWRWSSSLCTGVGLG